MFKVGDRVQAIRGSRTYYPAGALGTVQSVHGDMYLVKFDAGPDVDPACGSVWWISHISTNAAPAAESKPLHRANDPATSKGKRRVNKYELCVLTVLGIKRELGATGKEIAAFSGEPLNSITPRFAPLRRKGKIKELQVIINGEYTTIKRDKQIVWVLA